MDADLERKLRELIDRHEIWQVMIRYSRGIDRFDRELVRSAYYDDAVDDHHLFVGTPDEFIDWSFNIHTTAQHNTHHVLTNHTCEIVGDDAYAETYFTFFGQNKTPPHLMSMGRYVDHLQRRDGVWKIAARVCVIEQNFDVQESAGRDVAAGVPGLGPSPPATRDKTDLSYQRPVVPRRPPQKAA